MSELRLHKSVLFSLALLVFAAVNTYLGWSAPWWTPAVPAFICGWFVSKERVDIPRVATAAVIATWLVTGLINDIPTGFRLSSRIAGILSLPYGIFGYLVTLVMIGFTTWLAAQAGAELRAGFLARGESASHEDGDAKQI